MACATRVSSNSGISMDVMVAPCFLRYSTAKKLRLRCETSCVCLPSNPFFSRYTKLEKMQPLFEF